MIPGLRKALEEIDVKHREEPDLPVRDWRFEDDDDADLHGDHAALSEIEDEL